MNTDFHDIAIPPRMTEYALPLDTAVRFLFEEQAAALRLSIYSAGEERAYGGRGRILFPEGYARLEGLSMLDPFLQEKRLLPARYFKIFFRAQLPKLTAGSVPVSCDLQLAETPAVLITIRSCEEEYAEYDLRWYVARDTVRTISGFDGYVVAGNRAFRGSQRELQSIPHASDGAYTARGEELHCLRELYRTSPYLFDVRSGKIPFSSGARIADVVERIRDDVLVRRKVRNWGGPSLIRTACAPQNRTGTSRFAHFISEAKRLANVSVRAAEFVPFSCYWPTYANMSREQQAWYFYWRDAFAHGTVLKTDLSYLFVAIYEIINRAYPAGLESLERMIRIWEAYREAFPRLDYYLSQWCVDYVITNDLDFSFSEILRRIPLSLSNMRPFLEFYINDLLKTGLHALPFDVLCECSGYRMKASRFYKDHAELCEEAVRAALQEIDCSLRAAKQVGLLEYLAPRPKREVWESYVGAVCGRAAAKRIEAEYIPFSKSTGIRSFIGSVMRYVENALRKREKYAGRLRGIELSEAVIKAIDRSLAGKPEASPALVIDLSRAAELEQDSWDNTRRLIEAVEEDTPEQEDQFVEEEPVPEQASVELPSSEETEQTAPEGWQGFSASLESVHRDLLRAMLEGADAAALAAIAAQSFSFPEALYEEINELAADTLGDILIDLENGTIFEEHRAQLAAVL